MPKLSSSRPSPSFIAGGVDAAHLDPGRYALCSGLKWDHLCLQSQEPEELLQLQEGVVTGPALIGSWGIDNNKHQLR